MTVLDNITSLPKLRRVPKSEQKRRAVEVAELLKIDLMDRKPGQLSGSRQQHMVRNIEAKNKFKRLLCERAMVSTKRDVLFLPLSLTL